MADKKYLNFVELAQTGKTRRFVVRSVMSDQSVLGKIIWYSHWRRYTFTPTEKTIFDRNCLDEIVKFIDVLMVERSR